MYITYSYNNNYLKYFFGLSYLDSDNKVDYFIDDVIKIQAAKDD